MLFLITEYCTMGCKHCMSDSTPKSPHATLETVEAFIRFAQELGTSKIGISGGEPTSHPQFFEYFIKILESFNTAQIVLMSNGQFFRDNDFCNTLAKLQKKFFFRIQISSIEDLYSEYGEIVALYEEKYRNFTEINFVDQLFFLEEHLGRAKRYELSQHRTENRRTVPGCFNLYAICQQLTTLKDGIQYMDNNTQFNFCKPMIDASGNVRPSESVCCTKIGNVHECNIEAIYKILSSTQPCEACGTITPDIFKERFGWK